MSMFYHILSSRKRMAKRAIKRSVPISDLILYLEDMLDQSKVQLKNKRDIPIIYAIQLEEYFGYWGDEWQGDTMIVNEERKKAVRNLKRKQKRREQKLNKE